VRWVGSVLGTWKTLHGTCWVLFVASSELFELRAVFISEHSFGCSSSLLTPTSGNDDARPTGNQAFSGGIRERKGLRNMVML
jgi:hypothetical protein